MRRSFIVASAAAALAVAGFAGVASAQTPVVTTPGAPTAPQGPDVYVSSITPANPYIVAGDRLLYKITLRNRGDQASGPMKVTVRFARYLTIFKPRPSGKHRLVRRFSLVPGATRTYSIGVRASNPLPNSLGQWAVQVKLAFVSE